MIRLPVKLLLLASSLALMSCSHDVDYHSNVSQITVVPESGAVPERLELPQGWDDQTRTDFWFTSQGARIIPYSWFTWLEQPNSTELFRDAKHMEMLRYLPEKSSDVNPSGLPIGFVAAHDEDTEQSWVGMTCAACHTNQLDYQGKKLLIEGAPTLANFVLFFSRLVDALNETNQSDEKFDRFAKKVLGAGYSADAAAQLREALAQVALATAEREAVNALPSDYPEDFTSYARLDAFGNIQNAGTAFALHDLANKNTPDAPVSYPFLWGTHQSDVVQWNASAPNTPVVGPLARNVGEVIGVFGNLSFSQPSWWKRLIGIKVSYSSTVDIEGLGKLESWVKTLRSPQWPTSYFPAVDSEKAARGSIIYADKCAKCHQVIPRDQEGDKYISFKSPVSRIGTDPATAWNADKHMAKTLMLEGTKESVLAGADFGPESPAISIPVNGAIGVILKDPITSLEAGLRPITTGAQGASDKSSGGSIEDHVMQHLKELAKKATQVASSDPADKYAGLVYKGRPLNGIWATAPYLHNGSVPNLWELMQKGSQRVETFWVGSREFDPVNVGYDTTQGLNEFKVNGGDGQIMPGNSNRGHEFGTDLSDDDKWAVVEYMKTL